jgi:hypothetical protein
MIDLKTLRAGDIIYCRMPDLLYILSNCLEQDRESYMITYFYTKYNRIFQGRLSAILDQSFWYKLND